jgi:hypothetical protein
MSAPIIVGPVLVPPLSSAARNADRFAHSFGRGMAGLAAPCPLPDSNFQCPTDRLDFSIDWSLALASDTITAATWTADPGITIFDTSWTTTTTTFWATGGIPGTCYDVTTHVTTSGGRQYDQVTTIRIVQDLIPNLGGSVTGQGTLSAACSVPYGPDWQPSPWWTE